MNDRKVGDVTSEFLAKARSELQAFLPLHDQIIRAGVVYGLVPNGRGEQWAVTIETGPSTHPMCAAYATLVFCHSEDQARQIAASLLKEQTS